MKTHDIIKDATNGEIMAVEWVYGWHCLFNDIEVADWRATLSFRDE
jgi:hypothetical protein